MAEQRDDRVFHTDFGTSDGDMTTGEPLTGLAGKAVQDAATSFYDQIGDAAQGNERGEIERGDIRDITPPDKREFITDAGVSDGDPYSGEPMTGKAGEGVKDAASDFFGQLGSLATGRTDEEVRDAERG